MHFVGGFQTRGAHTHDHHNNSDEDDSRSSRKRNIAADSAAPSCSDGRTGARSRIAAVATFAI